MAGVESWGGEGKSAEAEAEEALGGEVLATHQWKEAWHSSPYGFVSFERYMYMISNY